MWQRIQTLYLGVALALLGVLFFHIDNTWWIVLLGVATFMQVVALLAYKFRLFQMRTAVIGAIMLIGLQVWMGIAYFAAADKTIFDITAVFPIIAAILNFLASRSILSDEMLVQSASRLRSTRKK